MGLRGVGGEDGGFFEGMEGAFDEGVLGGGKGVRNMYGYGGKVGEGGFGKWGIWYMK